MTRIISTLLLLSGITAVGLAGHTYFTSHDGQADLDNLPPLTHSTAQDCGASSLFMICKHTGRDVPLEEVRVPAGLSPQGTTLLQIKQAAERLGFETTTIKTTLEDLTARLTGKVSAVLHCSPAHFVAIIREPTTNALVILDPARSGAIQTNNATLRQLGWEGYSLILTPAPPAAGLQLVSGDLQLLIPPNRLKFDPDAIRLGKVPVGGSRLFKVKVQNIGKEPVQLESVTSGCGWPNVAIQDTSISPNGSTYLSGEFRAGTDAGAFRKVITIKVATPARETYSIELSGEVDSPYQSHV